MKLYLVLGIIMGIVILAGVINFLFMVPAALVDIKDLLKEHNDLLKAQIGRK